MAEVTVSEKDSGIVIQLVNNSGHFGTSYYDPIPIRNAQVELPLEHRPASVKSLMADRNVNYHWENGRLTVTVPELGVYEAVVVEK